MATGGDEVGVTGIGLGSSVPAELVAAGLEPQADRVKTRIAARETYTKKMFRVHEVDTLWEDIVGDSKQKALGGRRNYTVMNIGLYIEALDSEILLGIIALQAEKEESRRLEAAREVGA